MPIIRSSVLLLACVVFSQLLSGLLIPHKTSAPPGRNFFRHIVPYGRRPDKQTIGWRNQVALKNIFSVPKHIEITDNSLPYDLKNSRKKRATSPRDLSPGKDELWEDHPQDPLGALRLLTISNKLGPRQSVVLSHHLLLQSILETTHFFRSDFETAPENL